MFKDQIDLRKIYLMTKVTNERHIREFFVFLRTIVIASDTFKEHSRLLFIKLYDNMVKCGCKIGLKLGIQSRL
jgi:hypothetical protein